jgi:hypothetical protein
MSSYLTVTGSDFVVLLPIGINQTIPNISQIKITNDPIMVRSYLRNGLSSTSASNGEVGFRSLTHSRRVDQRVD